MIKHCSIVYLDTQFDIEKMKVWRNDRRIYKWCRQQTLISWEDHEKWYKSLEGNKKDKMFSIHVDNESFNGNFIGVCGLTNIDYIARHAEFSIYIGPEYHGNGYAGRALFTLIKHGFDEFNLNKIWGETFEGNPATKLFKKLYLTETPGHPQHYFKNGMYVDTKFFYILASDFYKNQDEIYKAVE